MTNQYSPDALESSVVIGDEVIKGGVTFQTSSYNIHWTFTAPYFGKTKLIMRGFGYTSKRAATAHLIQLGYTIGGAIK